MRVQLWSWGEGGCGQLGIGRVTERDRPVKVADAADDGSRFADVACGWAHAIAITEARSVYGVRTVHSAVAPGTTPGTRTPCSQHRCMVHTATHGASTPWDNWAWAIQWAASSPLVCKRRTQRRRAMQRSVPDDVQHCGAPPSSDIWYRVRGTLSRTKARRVRCLERHP